MTGAILLKHLQCVFVEKYSFQEKKKLLLRLIASVTDDKKGEEGNGRRTRKSCRAHSLAAAGLWHVEGN